MHSSMIAVAGFAAAAYGVALPSTSATPILTLPSPISSGPILATFVPPPPPLFSNLSCTIDATLFPGQPLHELFGVSNFLGTIIGPELGLILGTATVNNIDAAADELCVSAQQEPDDGDGFCQFTLAAINSFAIQEVGQKAADKYRCLLNLLCVAPTGFNHPGTCGDLLAGLDCNANRLVTPTDKECDGDSS